MTAIPEGGEVAIELAAEGNGQVLEVAVVRSGADQQAARVLMRLL